MNQKLELVGLYQRVPKTRRVQKDPDIPVSMLLVTFLVSLMAPFTCSFDDRLITWLLKFPQHHCGGTVIVADDNYWASESFDTFLSNFSFPVTLLPTIDGSIPNLKPDHIRVKEKICSNLIVFNDKSEQVVTLIDQIRNNYFLYQTIVISKCEISEAVDALRELQDEQAYWVNYSGRYRQVLNWIINGDVQSQGLDTSAVKRSNKRSSMLGRRLKVTTIHYPPSSIISHQDGIDVYSGLEPSVLNDLAQALNFSITYFQTPADEMWGEILDNGTRLTGMIGQLWRKEVDLAFAGMYLHYKRLPFVDFVRSYKMTQECFLCPAPRPYAKWKAVYLPMTPGVWMVTMVSFVLATLMLHIVSRVSSSPLDRSFRDFGLCANLIFGSLLQMQQFQEIKHLANRFFLGSWFIAVLIIPTVYRSKLISFMTVPITPKPIDTLQQVADSSIDITTFSAFFKDILLQSTSDLQKKFGQEMIVNYNLSWAQEQVKNGQMCLLNAKDYIEYFAASDFLMDRNSPDRVHVVRECMLPDLMSFGVQKHSPLKPYLDKEILRMSEGGFIEYQEKRALNSVVNSFKKKQSNQLATFTLESMQSAFFLFFVGILMSVFAFAVEHIYVYFN